MATAEIFEGRRVQALDGARQPVLLDSAAEIKAGDWLRDLGTLRRVASIEPLLINGMPGATYLVAFEHQRGVEDFTLGIRENVPVTVWRPLG